MFYYNVIFSQFTREVLGLSEDNPQVSLTTRPDNMKLRVRINKQTSRVDLPGEEPTLTELSDLIKQTLLTSNGLGLNTEFSLSLNGSELLLDSGQTLSSFGIVSGDLICVLLRQPPAVTMTSGKTSSTASITDNQQTTTQRLLGPPLLMEPLQTSDELDSGPVWEPMLCSEAEEGQTPLSLELLYHSARVWSPNDAVIVAAHLLMLETGFTPQGNELTPEEMPAGWRSVAGVHKLEYVHPLCGTSQVSVVAVSMGPLLIINVALTVAGTIYSVQKLQLNASSYVTDEWPGESAAAAFKNLKKLSRVYKDQLVYPLIAAAREAMELPVAFGLLALPPELLLRVLRLLDVHSVVRLSAVSRHFNASAADSTLWRHLYRRDFSVHHRSRDVDWRELYKKSYKIRSEHRRVPRCCLPSFPFTPVPRPLSPPVPGIIGGEYDQRPTLPHDLLPYPRNNPIIPIADPAGRLGLDLHRPTGGQMANIRRGLI
uniref:F-box protein 7 n=1 Tax=Nothobranchius rachovii TaxID=451742 RepID=A0A1A8PYF3_9TELE